MRPNDVYYDNAQLPLFLTLITILWVVVGIRLWAFRKHYSGWKSWRGASTILTLACAILCTFYVAILITIYFFNEKIIGIRDIISNNPNTFEMNRDPATYSPEEVNTIIVACRVIFMLQFWLRLTLAVALWLTKFAFVGLFMETREALASKLRMFLYITGVSVIVTFIIVVWIVCQDIVKGWIHPVPEDIYAGVYTDGIRFVSLEPSNEFILSTTNIITDIFMVIIAIRTVTGLNRPITAASLIFVMVTITVSIAVGRVILNVFTMNDRFYTTYATIPLQLFAELETFFAAIVSCLPGLRVLIRQRREADNPPYVENTVIVPDHEMSDMSDSTRSRFSDAVLGAKYDTLQLLHRTSEDPFATSRAECSHTIIRPNT